MKRNFNSKDGFTLVEAMVIIAVITVISAQAIFSFAGLHEGSAINRSTRELALAIRKAQNMAFAVTQVEAGGTYIIPQAVGVRLSSADKPERYFIFADLVAGGARDNKYVAGDDAKIGSDGVFERGVKITSLKDKDGNSIPTAHIMFAAPEAVIALTDGDGNQFVSDKIDIELKSASGRLTKTITVRTSGQVGVK